MKTINAIFVYIALIKVCVVGRGAQGGHGGHSSHSGHSSHGYHGYHHVSASHTHYTYHPPRQIAFTCRYCSSSTPYPVYRHQPPSYVYVYKDSSSRYNQLLTGLALYNLGRTVEGTNYPHTHYAARQQEKCSLQIIDRSHFEETQFPCFMISSFVESTPSNTTRSIDITSAQLDVRTYIRKGAPLEVTDDQECVIWHNLTTHKERNHVPCALLKQYADTLRSKVPVHVWLSTLLGAIVVIYLCCRCVSKKNKDSVKEEAPLNNPPAVGYCANY